MCPLNKVEQETIESEEISVLIVGCMEQIKSMVEARSKARQESTWLKSEQDA